MIRTPRNLDLSGRLAVLARDFGALLVERRPDSAGVEKLFFTKNLTTGMAVAHARGVLYAALGERQIPVREYTPSQVKKAVTGAGGSDKGAVGEMVRRLLLLDQPLRPDDAADAAAVALCHGGAVRLGLPQVPVASLNQTAGRKLPTGARLLLPANRTLRGAR